MGASNRNRWAHHPGIRTSACCLPLQGSVWAISALIFFLLPDDIDGAHERYLGLLAFALIAVLFKLFITRGRKVDTKT